jgi:hypothetical protein
MKCVDYACAWTLFVVGVVGIMNTEIRHPLHAVLDTPLLWLCVAMFNLLRLRNGYSVANLKVFCIGANLATLALETVRLKMFGFFDFGFVVALLILTETILSLRRQ